MKKRLLALIVALLMTVCASPAAIARGTADPCEAEAAVTNNEGHWEYWGWQNWSQPIRSYLCDNGDGSVTRVEYTGSVITVEDYDSERNIVSARTIELELPLFGGFFFGSEYNYFVFGQENPESSDEAEVFRTVKYSKDWTRLGAASVYGANTYIPFEAGSLRMTEYEGYLVVRTSHQMYSMHQANITYIVNSSTMEVRECWSSASGYGLGGYCSHSFNQFVAMDGDKLIALDHGDVFPRAAFLVRYTNPVTQNNTLGGGTEYVFTVEYPSNSLGANYTFTRLGGLEVTSKGYMTAGNTSLGTASTYPRNVYLTVTDRNDFTKDGTKTVWLTNYTKLGASISNPQLIKINDDKLLVLWKEIDTVKYVFVDGSGNLLSDIIEAPGYKLSDCQPVVIGDKVEWYVTSNSAPEFYSISAEIPEPILTPEPTATPEPAEGAYVLVTDPAEITSGDYVVYGVRESYGGGMGERYDGAMGNTVSNGSVAAHRVTISENTVVDPEAAIIWHFEAQPDGSFTLYNADAEKYLKVSGTNTGGMALTDTAEYGFTVEESTGSANTWFIRTTESNHRVFCFFHTDFKAYDPSNTYYDTYLYKFVPAEQPTCHTVNFYDWDGTLLSTQQVEDGAAAVAPEDPVREGYTFVGWDVDFSCVTGDLNVTALYEAIPAVEPIPGDVNCDGILTSADISALFAYIMNAGSLTEQGIVNADLNGDGVINTLDVTLLSQLIFGA